MDPVCARTCVSEGAACHPKAGRALFHNYRLDLDQPKACVDCHTLPAGSSSTITEIVTQPVESAALRNVFAREGIVVDARPGHVRVSPFFYNSTDEIETFCSVL